MTTTVYYWPPHEQQVGHVAIGVAGAKGAAYLSWWPADGSKDDGKGMAKSIIIGVPGARFTLDKDVEGEGGRQPITTAIDGLDEAAMIKWWNAEFPAKTWSLLNISCAQVAIDALRAGGADQFVKGFKGWLKSWQATYWKPSEVHAYAQYVLAGTRKP